MEHQLLELHNESASLLVVWIEPWGEELTMGPGVTWNLVDAHIPRSNVSVTYREGSVSVHTMPSAKVRWTEGGRVIWSS